MTKIRTILKSTKDANDKYPVLLCVSDRGKRAYFSTGFSVSDKSFETSKEGGRFSHGRGVKTFTVERREDDGSTRLYTNKEANDKLAALEAKAKEILGKYNEQHISWGFDQFRNDFTNAPRREYFLSFAEDIIEKEYQARGRYKSAEIARGAIQALKTYDPKVATRSFQDINLRYLNGFMDFFRKRGNSETTLKIRLGEIRRIFNLAIREKIINPELYPFSSGKEDGKVRIPKTKPSKTDQYLTIESMQKLARTPLSNHVMERALHLFLFSYYCRGMNWKDMALLTRGNFYKTTATDVSKKTSRQVTMMQYKRSKTKGEFDIQVTKPIQRELDWFKENTTTFGDYVLPIIRVNVLPEKLDDYLLQVRKRCNRTLRKIAEILELPEGQRDITIYTARHSFAMTMLDEGKPVEIISQALGHQSVETTKHYLATFSTTTMAEETYIDLMEDKKPKKTRTKKPKA